MELTQSKQERLIKELLLDYFADLGYVYSREYANIYFRKKEEGVMIQFEIQSTQRGFYFIEFSLSVSCVEKIINEVEIPTRNMEKYKSGIYFYPTIICNEKISSEFNVSNPTKTDSDCRLFSNEILEFMVCRGSSFIQKYSYLPNVLEEMDRLEKEGKDWNEILGGMGDRLFRALIISKLCNDPNYESKERFCDQKFQNVELLKSWQPNYAKLKDIVHNMKPLYNI